MHWRTSGESVLEDPSVPPGHNLNLSPSGKTFTCKTEVSLHFDKRTDSQVLTCKHEWDFPLNLVKLGFTNAQKPNKTS